MVVVALIGIMTAMIVPEMKGTFEDALLRSTSRELADALQLARSRAVSFNQPYRFRLQPASGEYVVERRHYDAGREEFIPLRDVPGCEGKLDTRIKIEFRIPGDSAEEGRDASAAAAEDAAANMIVFYPDGTADATDVLLQDRQGFRLALRINGTTARVKVLELPRE